MLSSDQWDARETVRVRLRLNDFVSVWSDKMLRQEAELWLASPTWIAAPRWRGEQVKSAAIVRWVE